MDTMYAPLFSSKGEGPRMVVFGPVKSENVIE